MSSSVEGATDTDTDAGAEGDATDRAASTADRSSGAVDRLRLWLVLEADRRAVTGAILLAVFLALAAVGTLSGATTIRTGDAVETLFQALVTATITGVTLVLTLNQVVLAQELGAAGDQRERMQGALRFRRDVADATDTAVSPGEPAAFLRTLIETVGDRARTLRAAGPQTGAAADAIDPFVATLLATVERTSASLSTAEFGGFEVIGPALGFDYSAQLLAARRIAHRHDDALDETAQTALSELIELLELFGPAREHFKTLYFQRELTALSQRILLVSVPALVVAGSFVAFFDPAGYRPIAGLSLPVLVAGGATLSIAPFVLLLAYVMRIATVTKRTLAIGPFVLEDRDDRGTTPGSTADDDG